VDDDRLGDIFFALCVVVFLIACAVGLAFLLPTP
jgi:hypothetical protein